MFTHKTVHTGELYNGRVGNIKKRSLTIVFLLLLVAGVIAVVLMRQSITANVQQRGYLHVEEESDGTLGVYDNLSLRADVSGIVRDHESGKWWFARNGFVCTDYFGFAESENEQWYVSEGLVDFTKNGLVSAPESSGAESWYVLGGKALPDYTGLTRDFIDCPAMMLHSGKVDEDYTGLAQNDDGWWYVDEGHMNRNKTGLVSGRINGHNAFWYVLEGKVQVGLNGYIPEEKGDALLLITGGHTAPECNGIFPDGKRFRHVENGRVNLAERGTLEEDGARWVLMEGYAWKVTTDRARMLYNAMTLLPEIIDVSMTQEEKLRACFDYVKGQTEGISRSPHLLSIEWPEVYAADIFEGDGSYSNCFSFAAAFAYLARAVGYTEVYACNSGGHGWAEVDGMVYDPERAANFYYSPCFGLDYQYLDQYRQAMQTAASDEAVYDWMHVKIFDIDREES